MPAPKAGEKLSDFIGRFVAPKTERRVASKPQRLAVSYAEAKEQASKSKEAR
jgi:hypothetical protein